ncbi:hypothetical protein AAAC13_01660 [Pseudomonas aeruginosa]
MSRLLSEPDGFSRQMHEHMVSGDTKGAAAQVFAQAFSSQFKGAGAVNYIEAHFESRDPEVGPIVVTLQRRHGMTPGQLRARAELAASNLQGLLQEMLGLDHWLDEEIAPADLIARCRVATSEPLVISPPLAQALVERIRQIEGEGFTLQGTPNTATASSPQRRLPTCWTRIVRHCSMTYREPPRLHHRPGPSTAPGGSRQINNET